MQPEFDQLTIGNRSGAGAVSFNDDLVCRRPGESEPLCERRGHEHRVRNGKQLTRRRLMWDWIDLGQRNRHRAEGIAFALNARRTRGRRATQGGWVSQETRPRRTTRSSDRADEAFWPTDGALVEDRVIGDEGARRCGTRPPLVLAGPARSSKRWRAIG